MIEHRIEELTVELSVSFEAPKSWGEESFGEGRWEGTERDYFKLERLIPEIVESGELQVNGVEDMYAGSEGEGIRISVTDENCS